MIEANAYYNKLATAKEKDAFISKTFGLENKTAGLILMQNVGTLQKITKEITGTNAAYEMAAVKSNTLSVKLDELKNAWINMLTGNTQANGVLGSFKWLIEAVTNNLGLIVGVIGTAIGLFVALKTVVLASKIALFAYNVVLGLTGALSGTASIAIGANTVALQTYTAVQWLANAALWGFPLTWIIAAFVAVGAAIVALVVYWEDMINWVLESNNIFAKLIRFALYPVIALFKVLGAVFNYISTKFSELIEWIKTSDSFFAQFIRGTLSIFQSVFEAIGTAIAYVIDAFSSLWQWIKKIASGPINTIASIVDMFSTATQKELGVNVNNTSEKPLLNTEAAKQNALVSKMETTKNKNVTLTINDPQNRATVSENTSAIPARVGSTMQSF